MKKPFNENDAGNVLYKKIIGLGEKSIRKSYYPQLRQKVEELERINLNLEHEIGERKRREEELHRSYESQRILNGLLKRSLASVPVDDLLALALDALMSFSLLENRGSAAIYFLEDGTDILALKYSKETSCVPSPACEKITIGQCFCGKAAQVGRIISSDHKKDGIVRHKHYSVPILLDNKTIGLICIILPNDHIFDSREESFLGAMADTLASIIQRQNMVEEKKKIEHQLYKTQKIEAIGVLAGGIAHDFNNLLTPILGYAEMALMELPDDDPIIEDLNEVVKAAQLAKELVGQILSLSRQSAHELKPLRLHSVINETLKLIRASIPSTIEIKKNLAAENDTVLADFTQIHQVIMNLCTNAYHAMKSTGGTLSVELHNVSIEDSAVKTGGGSMDPGDYLMIEVSDTGMGMSEIVQSRIFDPYFTTKGKDEGTGLGLSVVHGIVRSYGGDITVYSELGKGTVFQVFLPNAMTDEIHETDDVWVPVPGGSEHVMVVDDEDIIVQMIQAMLTKKGYTVTGCQGSEEALELFQADPSNYSLVITDMTMPRMTGSQLSRALREIRPDIPIILCTGFSEQINEQVAMSEGFQSFLMKPIIMNDLCQIVRKVLDNSVAAGIAP